MKTLFFLLFAWSAASVSALAQSPTLIEGHVDGYWWLFCDPSPTPFCIIQGDTPLVEGESFQEDIQYDEEPCLSSWAFHCSADSLGYRGSWTTEDPTHTRWHIVMLEYNITAKVSFPTAVRLFVSSESSGVLTEDSHLVKITPANEDEVVLLGPIPGGLVEADLPAGVYTINLAVDVKERTTHYDYFADLQVWWEADPGVGVSRRAWGAVKSMYR